MNRRIFLQSVTQSGIGLWLTSSGARAACSPPRPNIIYIYTDQQHAKMMSCAGNSWLKTPAMDYIAQNGIRFTRAYTTNPVCSPARVSLMTGRFAGTFSDDGGKPVRENGGALRIPRISDDVRETTLAAFLQRAGYDLVYGGKQHLPPPLAPEALGFHIISNDDRGQLAVQAAEYVRSHPRKPYFMIVSFINPHDICYMAIRDVARPEEKKRIAEQAVAECAALDRALAFPVGVNEEEFFRRYCPPLPPNFEPQYGEPRAIASLLDRRGFRRIARETYTERDWRRHRWAYCRLTEFVDREVQIVLDAVRQTDQEDNTLILFSSDHGDMDASHRMEHKDTFYEESANVPLLAMWKGHIPAGRVDERHLVSSGLDLLPTVCDYAGIQGLADPRGRSLRPLLEGKAAPWRATLGVESEIGRMVVDQDGFKFIQYDAVGTEEQLLDLTRDPHETTHFTSDPVDAAQLHELRRSFETEWFSGL